MITLHHADASKWIKFRTDQCWDMVFMDPPDNIGLDYGPEIDDNRIDYYHWLRQLIVKSMGVSNIVWVSYYWKHDLEVKHIVRDLIRGRGWEARTFIWNFNFGQYGESDCPNNHRPILRISRVGTEWYFPNSIRVESERTRCGDIRAKGPRVPGDVWHYPRVTGNNLERRDWIKTQHPEALLGRMVVMSGANRVLELFSGSGTMIRVARRLGFDLDTVELNSEYVRRLEKEHDLEAK